MSHRLNPRWFALLLLLILAAAAWPPRSAHAAQKGGPFREVPCSTFVDSLPATESFRCGYLTVPEQHAQPDGATIQLAVMVVPSRSPNPQPDPLVMMQGGPGGSTIDLFSQIVTRDDFTLRDDRDIVLFDQRGTLYSRPNLLCSEDIALADQTLDVLLTPDELERMALEATQRCRARLERQGINLAAYNSLENAADVASLRLALGYDQINLYGVSYGTLLAQHIMATHPDGIRSVILDAVAPTDINFLTQVAQSQERSFEALFAACAADAGCARSYPNLEQHFNEQVARLNATPARIPLRDLDTGKAYSAYFDGNDLRDAIFQMLYSSETLPLIPVALDAVAHDDFTLFTLFLPLVIFDRTISSGMYYSVMCAEDADFAATDVEVKGVREVLGNDATEQAEAFIATCDLWDVPALDSSVDAPVQSDIPTLLLSGAFDPITPPAFAQHAALSLPNSTAVTFPNTAHGALISSDCADQIARDFLTHPNAALDTSCAAQAGPPTLASRSTMIRSPLGARIVDLINGEGFLAPLILLLALLALLSLFLMWPLFWLLHGVSSWKGGPTNALATSGAFAALLAALLPILMLAGLAVVLTTTFQTDEAKLLWLAYGFPREWWPILLLGLLTVPALLVMGVTTVALWWQRLWTLPERLYYTFLTGSALLLVVAMARAGLLVNPLA